MRAWAMSVEGTVAYLDYNATAPLRPQALEAMLPVLRTAGNAASPHSFGREAAHAADNARRELATLIHCSPGEIVYTSGATEANNLALGAAYAQGGSIATSTTEHPAVLEAARALTSTSPGRLAVVPVDSEGRLDLAALGAALSAGAVSIVSVMTANNETGVLNDLDRVADIAHQAGALVHTDATQMVGRLPVDLSELDVDMLSLSAHKFGGPQGVGALFIRRGTPLPHRPLLYGGGQEKGWRAGTLNVAGVVGMGAAAAAARNELDAETGRVTALRDLLEQSLLARIPGSRVNSQKAPRLPGVSSITLPGCPADAVLAAMPEVAASDGSACSSGVPAPSHVLQAMGLSSDDAECTVRFSLGYATTRSEIEHAIEAVVNAVQHIRATLGTEVSST